MSYIIQGKPPYVFSGMDDVWRHVAAEVARVAKGQAKEHALVRDITSLTPRGTVMRELVWRSAGGDESLFRILEVQDKPKDAL